MPKALKLALPLLLATVPAAAQEPVVPEKSGPVTRQTAIRDTPLLDFEYSWPEAVSSQAPLVAHFKADLSKSYDEALKNARENKTATEQYGGPFNQNMFNRVWTLEGQTARLISLVANTDTFTGGAHPNHDSFALLWDRSVGTGIDFAQLFESPAGLESAVKTSFCRLLDAERLKRREGEKLDGEFSECPAFSELTIAPVSKEGSSGFDSIVLIADPYVAGPYAEGDYTIIVPVSAALVAALKPEFRNEFTVQPQ
jgi:hypothetical protein